MEFDKDLLAVANFAFDVVYVDRKVPNGYVGSEFGHVGDRVRIYPNDLDYSEEYIVNNNEELKAFIENWVSVDPEEIKEEYRRRFGDVCNF